MVGAAEGLGGKLMRTVSFFGWTFPVSFFGGRAPLGILGIFSAIKFQFRIKLKLPFGSVKLLIRHKSADAGRPPFAPRYGAPNARRRDRTGALSAGSGLPVRTTRLLSGLGSRFAPGRADYRSSAARALPGAARYSRSAPGPWNSLPWNSSTALFASSGVENSTKAKPRDLPVARSSIRFTEVTTPAWAEILLKIVLHRLVGEVAHEEPVLVHKVRSAQEN